MTRTVVLALVAVSVAACSGPAKPIDHPAPRAVGPAEAAAYETAKPVFTKYCAECHTTGGPGSGREALEHFDMSGYPFGGHHAATIGAEVREVLGATGEKPTMPKNKPGIVTGDELAAILAWADAFDAAQ